MTAICSLHPGQRFASDYGTGTVELVNECRVRVRLDRPAQIVRITDREGQVREFIANRDRVESWARSVPVQIERVYR